MPLVPHLLLVLLLSTCLPGIAQQAPRADDRVSQTPPLGADPVAPTPDRVDGDPPAAGAVMEVQTEQGRSNDASDAPAPLPPILAADARACQARGGTLRPREAGGLWSCVRIPRDAGQLCRTGADCDGLCLARTGTCAPFEPLFGCHEALDPAGRPQTVCRD